MTLDTWLWIAQGLLAAIYGPAGLLKMVMPIPRLAKMMVWPGQIPVTVTRFIGAAELAGAIAMILPIMLDTAPVLTPIAAIGLSVVQVLAIGFHYQRGELRQSWPINGVFLALSLFVAIGRADLF
jgi:hypothetical protein